MARLPYRPRPGQQELSDAVARHQREGRHLVAEAATGTGKTIAVLAASLENAKKDRCKVLWATRTNSQQVQVQREHKALVDHGAEALLVPLTGRGHACPLLRDDPDLAGATGQELSRLCRRAKAAAQVQHHTGKERPGACPYYLKLLEDGTEPAKTLLAAGCGEQAAQRIAEAGSCPYETFKRLLPEADIITLPYTFLLDDGLRQALASWIGTGLDGCHIVIDEAHNLPEAARSHHSPRLSLTTLQRALREAQRLGDPALLEGIHTQAFLHALIRVLLRLVDEYVQDRDDALLPPDALQSALLHELRLPSPALQRLAQEAERWGDIHREELAAKGKLPRSYLGSAASFLSFWLRDLETFHAPIATGGKNPDLEACLLDPSAVLHWLQEAASTTHISGTLAPLKDHARVLGLGDNTGHLCLTSPFDPDHLRLYGVDGVHRRWQLHQEDPSHALHLQEAARAALRQLPGRTALFFPSHQMLSDYLEEGFLHGIDRPLHQETPDMDQRAAMALVDRFRSDANGDALLLAVLGGRLTEGIDYPGDTLQNLLILGIPYPRPTARSQALIHVEDARDGRGWQRVVHNPVARVLRQAIGRLIRGPDETGVAVVLDERIVRFRDHLPLLTMVGSGGQVQGLATPLAPQDGAFENALQVAQGPTEER
ncbi:MAG: ATP-dependent DNA helicase [Thermoplasmatota archaeon]